MKFNIKKICITLSFIFVGIYFLFLILPFIISPIINSFSDEITNLIKDSTGYEAKIEGFGASTSFDLSAGVKAKMFSLYIPGDEKAFFKANNLKIRFSLLPLMIRKIQIHDVTLDSLEGHIVVKDDGNFLLFDYLKQHEKDKDEIVEESVELPWGLELSNVLPNFRIDSYNFEFIESKSGKSYFIEGSDLHVTDFVLDKHVKASTVGKIVFDGSEISNYNIKIYNKIMPDIKLQDLVFPKEVSINSETTASTQVVMPFNIIEIFESIKKNQLHANIFLDIKTSGTFKKPEQRGKFKVDDLTVAVNGKQLPKSYFDLVFKGYQTRVDSILYTSDDQNEKTQIIGTIENDKNRSIDLLLTSNAKINNVLRLIDSIAQSFGIEDFKTITATGDINANFNLSSDMKKVVSNGYLKVNPSSIRYGLYNIGVDNITADIDMNDNNINIKDAGFSILGHPLKLLGTISSDALADLKLSGQDLSIKGLLAAAGQKALLKDNNFNGGVLSLNVAAKGKLNELKPDADLIISGVDVFNKPSNLRILLSNALVNLALSGENLSGDIDINSMSLKMPQASVSVPKAKVIMDKNNINIENSYLLVNNSRVDVDGFVKNYSNDKLNMDISAKGNINASDIIVFVPKEIRSMFPYKGSLPLNISLNGDAKKQNISLDISATPSGYIKFADIDLLRGKTTKIHSDMKYSSADNLVFSNSSVSVSGESVATLSGEIRKLTSSPNLNLNIKVPNKVSFPIWGIPNSNVTGFGDIIVTGNLDNPQVKGTVTIPDISIKDMNLVISNTIAHLNGSVLNGNVNVDKFRYGNIIATKLYSDILLKNYSDFYMNDIVGDAFSGKINGKLSYNIPTTAIGFAMTGKGLNSTDAVYGAIGIKNALTGTLGFDANLTMRGVTDKEIINSMKGNVNFNIENGRFMGIGRLENFVAAQNIESISLLKSAISALSTLSTMQETNKFKSIVGSLTLSNGSANIHKIEVLGPLMSYYVNGAYYILPNSAYLVILGRLDSKVVSCLGVLGQLSAEKLLSYIPKLGASTAQILSQLTSDPANEKTNLIPALTTGSTSYKDFRVIFNGSIEKSSSVKNFRWLSKCDTTQLDLKKDVQDAAQAVKTNINNQINATKTSVENVKTNVNNIITTQKQALEEQKKGLEQTKSDIQNAAQNAGQSAVNLGKLFLNAASNVNQKMEIPDATKSEEPKAESEPE